MAASHAMISTWDDHEVMNDYAGAAGANGGDARRSNPPYFKGWSDERKINAYKAWFDNMPTFPQETGGYKLYHKASFGKNLDLWVLDERQYRDAQPGGYHAGGTEIDPATATDLDVPRAFLGAEQLSFIEGGLAGSSAKWKVIANEVIALRLNNPDGKIESADDWTAYPRERQALLGAIRDANVQNVVFATGDYHTFMAGQVKDAAGNAVATEFASGSVTQLSNAEIAALVYHSTDYGYSASKGQNSVVNPPAGLRESDYLTANPHLKEFDQLHHGYVLASASSTAFTATFKKLKTTRSKSTTLAATKKYTVAVGSTSIS